MGELSLPGCRGKPYGKTTLVQNSVALKMGVILILGNAFDESLQRKRKKELLHWGGTGGAKGQCFPQGSDA